MPSTGGPPARTLPAPSGAPLRAVRARPRATSHHVGDVHRHLVDLRRVKLLDVAQHAHVLVGHEVDRDALAPEPPAATDAVDVLLAARGQVVVDDERHLLHVEATAPHVGRDHHTRRAAAELRHDRVALLLRHVAVHRAHREVRVAHLAAQPVHLGARVAEDDGLRDRESVVEVAQRVELPILLLDRHEELLDALQRQLVALHQHLHGAVHELLGHVQHLARQRGGHQHHLRRRRQRAIDVVDLLLEAAVQHLVRLVNHQHLQPRRAQVAPPDHVEDAAGRAAYDVHTAIERANVFAQALASDAGVALDRHEPADVRHHLLRLHRQLARRRDHERLAVARGEVDGLQHTDAEHTRFASTALRLRNDVAAAQDGHDGPLLDRRRLVEAVGVDAAEQVLLQPHLLEGRHHLHARARLDGPAIATLVLSP
eukprot:CAMPEP_0203816648 /NCGR_PEP_ID=MMETSP0115-20131106/17212_1 /ASSEMBLY_ACC=CAM_ASM_000227 /TAXON_ID=33651 /ORGANISM="Bicosoecid sp, Strain ms1" /LENGTH=426 /DNA_ID=CAMNT_0050725555 /DNA_START=37 /DNA_END=1313 /DNA_ORIENTATION=+